MNQNAKSNTPAIIFAFLIGGLIGFFAGFSSSELGSDLIEGIFAEEEGAQLSVLQDIDRDAFSMKYPGNWKIDTEDEDYNPDLLFTINSPGNAYAMFVVTPQELTIEENLSAYVTNFTKLFKTPTIDSIFSYGDYECKGVAMNGEIFGGKTTVNAYSIAHNGTLVTVIEQFPLEDKAMVAAGFEKIKETFEIK